MDFVNCYQSTRRAEAYAKLEFSNTYHLAFRDLPEIFRAHVKGTAALDFGWGQVARPGSSAGLDLRRSA